MERKVYQSLLKWKSKTNRKPLIVSGVRQCGKTYLINEDMVDEYTKQLEYQLKEKDKKITELENMLKPVLDLNIPINTLINEFERLNELEDNMEISKLKSKDKKV